MTDTDTEKDSWSNLLFDRLIESGVDLFAYIPDFGIARLIELADAREAQRSYEANLKMFEQSRKVSAGLMDLLRR